MAVHLLPKARIALVIVDEQLLLKAICLQRPTFQITLLPVNLVPLLTQLVVTAPGAGLSRQSRQGCKLSNRCAISETSSLRTAEAG
jgi:hypothetical protein